MNILLNGYANKKIKKAFDFLNLKIIQVHERKKYLINHIAYC